MRKKTVGNRIENMINGSLDTLNTMAIARIERVDNSAMMCDIQLMDMPELFGTRDEVETIENVPIAPIFWGSACKVNAPLSVGDKVIVLFCQHDTYNARNSDEPQEPLSNAKFDFNNAVVVGQITKDSDTNINSSAFYVNVGGSMLTISNGSVEITAGNITINGNTTINGDLTVSGTTITGGSINLNTHIHSEVMKGGDKTGGPE